MGYVQTASEEIRIWAEKMGWKELREVPCRPDPGFKEGICFANVERMVELHGGAPCFGHMFVEIPGQAIQTEAHAVWQDPGGNLIDITEEGAPVPQILFAPDQRVEESRGTTIGEHHLLSTDPRVRRLFDYERALEQWVTVQILAIEKQNQQDPARVDFASLRRLIAEADLPRKLAGTFLMLSPKLEFVFQNQVVPRDILQIMEE